MELNPKKPFIKKYHPIIFSIFFYISIFYIFNLSPSTDLFKTSKFWFLISNTLVPIIAAHYGAVSSSSKNSADARDEYFAHSRQATRVAVTTSPSPGRPSETPLLVMKNNIIVPKKARQESDDHIHIQEKRIVYVDDDHDKKVGRPIIRTYRRSKSEKAKRVVIDETKNSVVALRRSETKRRELEIDGDDRIDNNIDQEVNNEFSTMSDEDLHRRVEEFIQRFNRQIRLQARDYNN